MSTEEKPTTETSPDAPKSGVRVLEINLSELVGAVRPKMTGIELTAAALATITIFKEASESAPKDLEAMLRGAWDSVLQKLHGLPSPGWEIQAQVLQEYFKHAGDWASMRRCLIERGERRRPRLATSIVAMSSISPPRARSMRRSSEARYEAAHEARVGSGGMGMSAVTCLSLWGGGMPNPSFAERSNATPAVRRSRAMTTALSIVGDRAAKLPIEYDRALQALVACTHIDEARLWDNKADALSAWAKIYRNDRAGELAKQLKLHAYRRMGELAEELAPKAPNQSGPRAALLAHGLSMPQASAARCLARMTPKKFKRELLTPASPVTVAQRQSNRRPVWKRFGRASSMLVTYLEELAPEELADGIRACGDKALVDARSRVRFMIEKLTALREVLK